MSRGYWNLRSSAILLCLDPHRGATKKRWFDLPFWESRFTLHRAKVIPSWLVPCLQDLERAESRVANGARQGEDLSALSSSGSHKTNFGAARNWQRPGAPSKPRDWPHAGLASYHNNRCSRTLHSGEGEATTLRS
jgi:hypothetical protein